MTQRTYIDFKLYLTHAPDSQGACQVALLPTPEVGETIAPLTIPAAEAAPADLLPLLASGDITHRALATLGKKLANCLLPEGTIRERFRYAYDRVGAAGGVRLRLIIADHALKQWPWEYVYLNLLGGADSMRGFLALDPRISIVRHEPLPFPHPAPATAAAALTDLRMVLAAASPKGQPKLRVDKEVALIQAALKDFAVEGVRLKVDPVLMDVTPPELEQALRQAAPAFIFHFAGHGDTVSASDWFNQGALKDEGYLYLVADKARQSPARVDADDVARLLQQAGVRLAVLGACKSGRRDSRYPWDGVAGALAAREIPAIIAMQYAIEDSMATAFSQALYSGLSSRLVLDEAMYLGRAAMLRQTSADPEGKVNTEWGVPVLYSRLPDGALLPPAGPQETESARQLRAVIQQNVETIASTGQVVGVEIGNITGGSVSVKQKVGTVSGTLIGARFDTL